MSKTKVLLAYGDGDYGAMDFEEKFKVKDVYAEMLENNVTEIDLIHDCGYGDEEIHVTLHEFAEVDPEFVGFIFEEFMEYDNSKAKCFYIVD